MPGPVKRKDETSPIQPSKQKKISSTVLNTAKIASSAGHNTLNKYGTYEQVSQKLQGTLTNRHEISKKSPNAKEEARIKQSIKIVG